MALTKVTNSLLATPPAATVAARYLNAAAINLTSGTNTIIQYDTIDYDTHGAVTTGASWKFTAPISGKYSVHATFMIESIAQTTSTEILMYLYKNGGHAQSLWYQQGQASSTTRLVIQGSDILQLAAGDYITIVGYQSSGSTVATRPDSSYQSIQIVRVGN